MPDIAMCNSSTCPSRFTCYRHEAEPNPFRQSYMAFDALRADGDPRCGYYTPIVMPIEEMEAA